MAAADDSDDDVPEAEQRRRASLCLYAHGDDASTSARESRAEVYSRGETLKREGPGRA